MHDFTQIEWDEKLTDDCRQIVRLAIREDLDRFHDWTTVALVSHDALGAASIVARNAGVIAGLPAAELVLDEMNTQIEWTPEIDDGDSVEPGTVVAWLRGSTRDLLTSERTLLNLLGRLSGIATLTRTFTDAIAGHRTQIYDTRKTTPGWRRLEKYAVRCGGGRNHRTGLYDGVLIKDNHLASGVGTPSSKSFTPAEAVERARTFLAEHLPVAARPSGESMLIEIEVDTLEQLAEVLPAMPDLVLLDNMAPATLSEAVVMRDVTAPSVQLEASGGVSLDTVARIAATGVDRISVGALTHSASVLDLGLDWNP